MDFKPTKVSQGHSINMDNNRTKGREMWITKIVNIDESNKMSGQTTHSRNYANDTDTIGIHKLTENGEWTRTGVLIQDPHVKYRM